MPVTGAPDDPAHLKKVGDIVTKLGFHPKSYSGFDITESIIKNFTHLQGLDREKHLDEYGTVMRFLGAHRKLIRTSAAEPRRYMPLDLVASHVKQQEGKFIDNKGYQAPEDLVYSRMDLLKIRLQSTIVDVHDIVDGMYNPSSCELNWKTKSVFQPATSDIHTVRQMISGQRARLLYSARQFISGELTVCEYQWNREDAKIKNLIADYTALLNEQVEHIQNLWDRWDCNERANFKADYHVPSRFTPKERVAKKLLMTDEPEKDAAIFISKHFTKRDEYLCFLMKMQPIEGLLRCPQPVRLPEEVDMDHVLRDILNYRSPHCTENGLQFLNRIRQVLQFEFLPKEWKLINFIDSFETKEFDGIKQHTVFLGFDLEEMKDLCHKIKVYVKRALDYKVWASGQDILVDQFNTVSKDLPPLPFFRISPAGPSIEEKEKQGLVKVAEVVNSILARIGDSKDLQFFLLDPEIVDLLTVEEKSVMLFHWLDFPEDYNPYISGQGLESFKKKLDLLEARIEAEGICYNPPKASAESKPPKKKNSPFWTPSCLSELTIRENENRMLANIFYLCIMFVEYDLADPRDRYQFNKDFKYMFTNRHIVLDRNYNFIDKITGRFRHELLRDFYTQFLHSVPQNSDTYPEHRIYLEELQDKVNFERWRREDMMTLMGIKYKVILPDDLEPADSKETKDPKQAQAVKKSPPEEHNKPIFQKKATDLKSNKLAKKGKPKKPNKSSSPSKAKLESPKRSVVSERALLDDNSITLVDQELAKSTERMRQLFPKQFDGDHPIVFDSSREPPSVGPMLDFRGLIKAQIKKERKKKNSK